MEISYNSTANNTFALNLIGAACIPHIELLRPVVEEHNKCSLYFPLIYVGECETEDISLKNVGEIPCKVIMDMSKNQSSSFVLETCEDSIKYLNLMDPGEQEVYYIYIFLFWSIQRIIIYNQRETFFVSYFCKNIISTPN